MNQPTPEQLREIAERLISQGVIPFIPANHLATLFAEFQKLQDSRIAELEGMVALRDRLISARIDERNELAAKLKQQESDYEEVLDIHRKLVKRLDVTINGEAGAAQQASLCDLVSQIEKLREEQEPVGVFANVNAKGERERWEHMVDESYDGKEYIYLYSAPVAAPASTCPQDGGKCGVGGYCQPAIPEGYALVPVEPTEKMIVAGAWMEYYAEGSDLHTADDNDVRDTYKAMIAAAQGEQK